MLKKEFMLLVLLASNLHRVFKREEILEKLWGNVIVGHMTMNVYMRKLREKFGNECFLPSKVWGIR